jgi:hypothetical protein
MHILLAHCHVEPISKCSSNPTAIVSTKLLSHLKCLNFLIFDEEVEAFIIKHHFVFQNSQMILSSCIIENNK